LWGSRTLDKLYVPRRRYVCDISLRWIKDSGQDRLHIGGVSRRARGGGGGGRVFVWQHRRGTGKPNITTMTIRPANSTRLNLIMNNKLAESSIARTTAERELCVVFRLICAARARYKYFIKRSSQVAAGRTRPLLSYAHTHTTISVEFYIHFGPVEICQKDPGRKTLLRLY